MHDRGRSSFGQWSSLVDPDSQSASRRAGSKCPPP